MPSFPPTVSFWEIKQFLKDVDLLIVGGGIVGLSAAIHYKKANPQKKVTVVERGSLPLGASTKNAGFACFGSVSEILSDLKSSNEEAVFELVAKRLAGLQALRKLLGDEHIDYQPCGGYEVFRDEDEDLFEKCLEVLPEFNKKLSADLSLDATYRIANDRIREFGFSGVRNLILNQHEGSLDTGKMMEEMLKLAINLDVVVLQGMEVSDWAENANGVEVHFKNDLSIKTKRLHFATNGLTKLILPHVDVEPARAQVLVTSEIPNLRVKGTFHLDEGYFYFRNVGNRILFGGGRNLDLNGEQTTEIRTTELIQNELERLLSGVILPQHSYTIEHRWAGIMGVGKTKKTIVEQLTERTSCSVRLGGMGVAIGTLIGKEAAEMLT